MTLKPPAMEMFAPRHLVCAGQDNSLTTVVVGLPLTIPVQAAMADYSLLMLTEIDGTWLDPSIIGHLAGQPGMVNGILSPAGADFGSSNKSPSATRHPVALGLGPSLKLDVQVLQNQNLKPLFLVKKAVSPESPNPHSIVHIIFSDRKPEHRVLGRI